MTFLVATNDVASRPQTWKKLQAVQVALADILSEITLFRGIFERNIPYFLLIMKKNTTKWNMSGTVYASSMYKFLSPTPINM